MRFLIIVLFFLHFVESSRSILSNASNPVENSCIVYFRNLAQTFSYFTECAANYSRPFHLCQNCLKYYLALKDTFNSISNDNETYATSLFEDGLKCIDIVEATDKVQVVVKMVEIVETIWTDANCDDCFTSNNTLTPKIEEFYELHGSLQECIFNFTNKPSYIDPLFENFSPNCTLCTTCKAYYVNLTRHFKKMGEENSMCMDVVDLFNYTRISWSVGYRCNYRNIDTSAILSISGTVLFMTIIFYISIRLLGKKT